MRSAIMRVLFRYDDFSETSSAGVDLAVLEAIVSHGFKPLLGVIPAIADVDWELGNAIPLKRLSAGRAQLLKRFLPDHIEIALHGYTHQTVTRFSGLSEFGDVVSHDRQLERMRDGKRLLEDAFGGKVDWFIPPWNTYGVTTLNAMKECGLRGVSADASFGAVKNGLHFAPQTCQLHGLAAALACCKADPSAHIVVMLHGYDFQETADASRGMPLSRFDQLLSRLKGSGVRGASFSEVLAEGQCSASRALANQELRKRTQGPLRFFLHPGISGVYWRETTAKKKLAQLEFWTRPLRALQSIRNRAFVGKS